MKVVIAPQSFKGGLPGVEVAKAIELGILEVFPQAETVRIPVADGGDGTLDALVHSTGGEFVSCRVTGPLGEPVTALWGVMGDGETAVIEMARASGLALVPLRRRNPRTTTSYGTGEIIVAALDKGYRRMIVGLGGSATNDGGVGMAQALGIRFLDSNGRELPFGGAALTRLARIDMSGLRLGALDTRITAATDVTNPLCGPSGASAVYGRQKGASPQDVDDLERALAHLGMIIKRNLGVDLCETPRAGAAGGLAAGLMAFLNAEVSSGIDLVCEALGLQDHLVGADLVITGEGRIDDSTAFDKAPVGVARRAKAVGVPVIAIVGNLRSGYEEVYRHGIDAVVPILDRPMDFKTSVARTFDLLRSATERTMRLLRAGNSLALPPSP